MLFYFSPKKQGDLTTIEWEAPTLVEKELLTGLEKKWWADIGRETGVRSEPQNRSLHLYLTQLASELNAGGFSLKFRLGTRQVDLDWTMSQCKELIWRPVQRALTGKKSTRELDKVSEIDLIYSHLNRFFSQEPFMFHIPWPSEETNNKLK